MVYRWISIEPLGLAKNIEFYRSALSSDKLLGTQHWQMNGEITYTSIVFIWGFVTEIVAFIEFEKEGKTAVVRREGICLEHVANTKPTEIISRKNLAPFVQKAGTLYLTYGPLLSEMKWLWAHPTKISYFKQDIITG